MRPTTYDLRLTAIIICFLIFNLLGCDAFVRKFTRKPKKDVINPDEMVLVPEEYTSELSKEGQYRQFLMYWKYWQEELINSFLQKTTHKKKVDCAQQALKNLINLRAMLNSEMQKKLDVYIKSAGDLKDDIAEDNYDVDAAINVRHAEDLKRRILRDFSFSKIEKDLI